jgi:hypothetical protein
MSIHRIVPAALAAGFALITTIPADAKPAAKPPKVKPATAHATTVKSTSHGPKTKPTTGSVKAHGAQAKAVKPTQAKGSAKTTTTTGKAKTKTSVDQASGSTRKVKADNSTGTARTDDVTGSRDIDPTTTRPAPLSKAQQQLLKNDNLRAKMVARLGGNIDPVVAAAGFKNLGQFVAAVNVSNNQGIAFKDLRLLMLGDAKLSLGQAIHQLKGGPIGTANAAADTAIATANRDLAASADVNTTSTKQKAKRNDRG